MLHISDLVVRYGAAVALDGVSLEVGRGEMVALVGPNGAGKSTLINTVSGLLKPASGSVVVEGTVAQVPEGRQMFPDMSGRGQPGPGGLVDPQPGHLRGLRPAADLATMRKRKAGRLSGGQQQMVAIGRALMARPDLLAIDELSLGLAPIVVAELAEHLRYLNTERGTAVSWSSRRSRWPSTCAPRLRAGGGPGRGDRAECRARGQRCRAQGLLR